jgi:hypothetical protein
VLVAAPLHMCRHCHSVQPVHGMGICSRRSHETDLECGKAFCMDCLKDHFNMRDSLFPMAGENNSPLFFFSFFIFLFCLSCFDSSIPSLPLKKQMNIAPTSMLMGILFCPPWIAAHGIVCPECRQVSCKNADCSNASKVNLPNECVVAIEPAWVSTGRPTTLHYITLCPDFEQNRSCEMLYCGVLFIFITEPEKSNFCVSSAKVIINKFRFISFIFAIFETFFYCSCVMGSIQFKTNICQSVLFIVVKIDGDAILCAVQVK